MVQCKQITKAAGVVGIVGVNPASALRFAEKDAIKRYDNSKVNISKVPRSALMESMNADGEECEQSFEGDSCAEEFRAFRLEGIKAAKFDIAFLKKYNVDAKPAESLVKCLQDIDKCEEELAALALDKVQRSKLKQKQNQLTQEQEQLHQELDKLKQEIDDIEAEKSQIRDEIHVGMKFGHMAEYAAKLFGKQGETRYEDLAKQWDDLLHNYAQELAKAQAEEKALQRDLDLSELRKVYKKVLDLKKEHEALRARVEPKYTNLLDEIYDLKWTIKSKTNDQRTFQIGNKEVYIPLETKDVILDELKTVSQFLELKEDIKSKINELREWGVTYSAKRLKADVDGGVELEEFQMGNKTVVIANAGVAELEEVRECLKLREEIAMYIQVYPENEKNGEKFPIGNKTVDMETAGLDDLKDVLKCLELRRTIKQTGQTKFQMGDKTVDIENAGVAELEEVRECLKLRKKISNPEVTINNEKVDIKTADVDQLNEVLECIELRKVITYWLSRLSEQSEQTKFQMGDKTVDIETAGLAELKEVRNCLEQKQEEEKEEASLDSQEMAHDEEYYAFMKDSFMSDLRQDNE